MRYYINGWNESKNYFFELGRFTEEEMKTLKSGDIVKKGANEFFIIY